MIALARHDAQVLRKYRQSPQRGIYGNPPAPIRYRSRANPAFVVAGVAAALLFDVLSSTTAHNVSLLLWEALLANAVAAIATALVIAVVAGLVIWIFIARFARSRGVHGAARAKE